MTIKAIIFDFDGTLMDTETCGYEAFCKVYKHYGQELALEKWAICIGTVNAPFDPYTHLQELAGKPLDRAELVEQFERLHEEELQGTTLRPGVVGILDEAKRLGLRIGLASSSDRKWINRHLQQQGIAEYFEVICTRDDVLKAKPDPALYLLALERLGLKADEAVAVEDSLNGLTAAKLAGLKAIAVPNPVTAQMNLSQADVMLDGFEGVSLDELISKLA
ncbi:HAD superfamily hydrolase (TIGR01509 family)/HAD superfamily hydrolase (TIGR01549 family) [Paenibacillus taihuensis]|uniref:HAD superfamily hydrolase (TIGR01509 family)/HAD superfamily hydrolase (TIGR01549 family) n=1 Tax=Paenibacillus taihuensis TaxID=1156355 RepID=A0A3D9RI20_9BACL|nr:HAD family hydrolase [Paenibacillus taihuensis]REE78729.1 HAD superfamily hydrolase (TIGR01509 family)/HAD superfamily hydrolase (TIGR01549 family) [Paenibacillus taihuensis]